MISEDNILAGSPLYLTKKTQIGEQEVTKSSCLTTKQFFLPLIKFSSVRRFRDQYRALRVQYPDQPLITLEDHLKVEEDLATALAMDMDPVREESHKKAFF